MKSYMLIFIVFLLSQQAMAATHVVVNSGTTFSPANLTVNEGDSVIFTLASMHNAVEVSQTTWNSNGTTSNGGFSLPMGGGTMVMSSVGDHYYVCVPHASIGMKGMIHVNSTLGVREIEPHFSIFNFYPNPVQDLLFVELGSSKSENTVMQLFSSSGLVVYSKEISLNKGGMNTEIIDMQDFPKGIYVLSLRKEAYRETRKIVKK